MPEFEETQPRKDPNHHYTPSENADPNKPRTRRRSGGFKGPAATPAPMKIGEVDPSEVLKKEASRAPVERTPEVESEPAAKEERREEPAPRERKAKPEASDSDRRGNRDEAPAGTPEPSSETLAAIQRVEARIAERRAERDARRKARGDKPAGRSGPRADRKPAAGKPRGPAKTETKPGLIGSIGAFVGKLLGGAPKEEAAEPKAENRGGNRGPRGQGGRGGRPRNDSRRRGGGRSSGNRRGGQGRSRPRRDTAPRD